MTVRPRPVPADQPAVAPDEAPLRAGGGDGTSDGADVRIARLETHMDYVRKDLDEIRDALKVLPQLATRRDLDTWRGQWLAMGVGIVALVIGGVVGGLALINHYAAGGPSAGPQPIVVQAPQPQSPPSSRRS